MECASIANNYIAHTGAPLAVDRLRDVFLMYLLLALMAYGAVKLVDWVVIVEYPASPLVAIVLAMDLGFYHDPSYSAYHDLLSALDGPAYLAMAAAAFLLYMAAARILAPRAASIAVMSRVFRAALEPMWVWIDTCAAVVDMLLRVERARDSLLAMAVAAYVTYLAIHLVDVAAIVLDRPDPPLAAFRGALYVAIGAEVVYIDAHLALLRAMDSLAFLSMLGATPLLASLASRTVVPACARLWRQL